jgi:hypothetical protein
VKGEGSYSMRFLSVGLLVAALPLFGGQQEAPLAPITLYTGFQQQPSGAILDAMRDELASIMAPMGLRFEWRSLGNVHGNEVAVELAVVNFKGRCEVDRLGARPPVNGPLGWTHVSDGAILPFADVDCDSIRAFVQSGLLTSPAVDRDERFGRAMARVLAHELYHIFANTPHHGSEGVGKAAYSVKNLLSDDFQFGEKESMALLTSKAHESLANSTNPAVYSSK